MAEFIKDTKDSKVEPKSTLDKHQDKIQETLVIKTEMDAYVSELIKGQPQSPDEIKVVDLSPGEGRHRLSLPRQIEKKYGMKYSFRWVNKKKDWIEHAKNERGWLIFNRVFFSDMPKHLFTPNGTVEIGDTILCFMPMEQAERLRRAPQDKSRDLVQNLPMEQWKKKGGEDSPFYKPTLGQEERDGEVMTAGIQPDVQTTT